MKKTIAVLALALAFPVYAQDSTPFSQGGKTMDFKPYVNDAKKSGKQFRIKGHCQSACTMFLTVKNMCIESDARLLFHKAKTTQGTDDLWASYNSSLKAYLKSKGAMERDTFTVLQGREMAKFGYRICGR